MSVLLICVRLEAIRPAVEKINRVANNTLWSMWHQLMCLLGSSHVWTTAYHPAANVERFHRQLKVGLSTAPRTQWMEVLPLKTL